MKKIDMINTVKKEIISAMIRTGIVMILFCLGTTLQAQNQDVSGTVRDAATGKPLMGVRITTDNQAASAITDSIGVYSIKVKSLSDVLIVSAPDYAVREVPLRGQATADIRLYASLFDSGYGTIESLSGNRRKTSSDQAANETSALQMATSLSVDSKIQELLGGDVRAIHRSGVNGMGAVMFMRGLNSLNAGAQPLFIVDGVVWDNQLDGASIHQGYFSNPLANINIRDIESITTLKDGNTLYGSKAANGVILINTVRTKEKATRITADLSMGINSRPSLPKMMNAAQYKAYASNQVYGWLQALHVDGMSEEDILYSFPFLDEDPSKTGYLTYHNNTDWANEVYRDAVVQDYSVGISGGDEIALFNLSLGYATGEGVIKNTDMERFTVRFNSDIKMSSKLNTYVDLSIGRTLRNLRDDGIDQVSAPGFISLVKAPILSPYLFNKELGEVSPKLSNYDRINPRSGISNPLALTNIATGTSSRMNFSFRINPNFRFNKNLLAGSIFSYKIDRVKESFFIPQEGVASRDVPFNLAVYSNEVRDLAQRQVSLFSDTYVKWNIAPEEGHNIDFQGGFRYMTDNFEWTMPAGYNTGNDNIKVLPKDLLYRAIKGESQQWKSMSWYAGANYDYRQKYILSLAASADASSRFGPESFRVWLDMQGGFKMGGVRWAFFPSVSGAWIVSSEDWMKNLPWINFLKLRLSYGLTGNDGIDIQANRSYRQSVYYMGHATGLELANIRNEDIRWETSHKAGAGLDIHFLDERVMLSADVYSSRTENLLTQKSLRETTGLSYYWSNGGALTNKGFELGLNVKLINTKPFKWELGGSVGHYKNRITTLPDGDYLTEILNGNILTAVGHPAGVFYGYKTKGVFATTAEAEAASLYKLNDNGTLSPYGAGDIHFDDPDGNGIITTKSGGSIGAKELKDDRQIIGDPNPDLYGTISNRFKLKRFTLDVLFTYSWGNDVYNYLRSQLESGASFYNQTVAMTNRWTAEGQVTNIPNAIYGDPMQNNIFSDRWIEDGSYIRLKTLTLSYEIPVNSIFLQGITLWASTNNLFTWTKYLGSDPEFSIGNGVLYQGIDAGLTPQGRSYFLGVKINL